MKPEATAAFDVSGQLRDIEVTLSRGTAVRIVMQFRHESGDLRRQSS